MERRISLIYMTQRLKRIALIMCLWFVAYAAQTQIIIDNTVDEIEAVEDILLGSGIEVFNITFSGDQKQIGSFTSNGANLEITEGVILGSGNVNLASGADFATPDAPGPGGNTQGGHSLNIENPGPNDADLEELSGQNLNDCVILEFDFIPQGDSLKFEFVFGSEEYNEFVGDIYNDAFGFFLSGPGLNGPFDDNAVNIAVIPGTTTPITINSVNLNQNSEYFVNNENLDNDPNVLEYDGLTTTLVAEAQVQCGELYHIKMALADGFDDSYDSAVFLEASSFSSNLFTLDLVQDLGFSANDSTLYENCGDHVIRFSRPETLTDEQTLSLEFSGTAENGLDYSGLPNEIVFAENQFEFELPITIIEDNLDEPLESLTISFESSGGCSGNSSSSEFTIYITDISEVEVSLQDGNTDCGDSHLFVPQVSGGLGEYSYSWSDGATTLENEVSPGTTTIYTLTVSDLCADPASASAEITVPEYPDLSVDPLDDLLITCGDDISVTTSFTGGNGTYSFNWDHEGMDISNQQNLNYTPDQAGVFTFEVTDGCGTVASQSFELTYTDISVDLGSDLAVQCLTDYTITPTLPGDASLYTFEWLSDGNPVSTETIFTGTGVLDETITLIITDACNEEASDELEITIPPVPISIDMPLSFGICFGDSAVISAPATGGVGELTYDWEGINATTSDILIRPGVTSSYSLLVSDVCQNSAFEDITVSVEELEASFVSEWREDNSVDLLNTTENAATLLWDLSENRFSSEERLIHEFDDIYIDHHITLHVWSDTGCQDSVSHFFPAPGIVYIPTAFTPDGDGLNDVFHIVTTNLSEYYIAIFDRDGHIVFESKDPREPWNGSNQRGDYYVPDGVYNYFLKATSIRNEVIERAGSITILR